MLIDLNALAVPAQACMLHNPHAAPTQSLPPFAGAGLLQVLLCVPPLQAVEQAPNRDHPPSTSASHMSKSNDRPSLQVSLANAMLKTIFIKYILQPGPSTLTWTGLRVAHRRRITYTIPAAIRTRRIAARSGLSSTSTTFRARPETGPSSV